MAKNKSILIYAFSVFVCIVVLAVGFFVATGGDEPFYESFVV